MDGTQMLPPPVLTGINPYSIDTIRDPYPFHQALRDLAPVVTLEGYEVYATGRYEEIRRVLDDWQTFSSASGVGMQDIRKPGKFRIPSNLVEADPPDHSRVRAATTQILSPKLIRSWRELFEGFAREVVDRILEMETFDAMEDFVEAFVLKAFPAAVGVDLPRDNVIAIGEMRFNQTGPDNELLRGALERAAPYLDWYEHSVDREGVLPGSIAEQLYEAEDRGQLHPGDAKSLVRTLIGGGTDSTIAGIGACMFHLANDPEQMAMAVSDPSLMKTALDEGIRLESPFQVIYRTPNRDVDFAGYTLEKDRKLGLWLGSGNRDPRKWTNPDKFDLSRRTAGVHIAFGSGIHVCIGQMIARLESECLLTEFARRVARLEPVGEAVQRPMNQMRSHRNIPLRAIAK